MSAVPVFQTTHSPDGTDTRLRGPTGTHADDNPAPLIGLVPEYRAYHFERRTVRMRSMYARSLWITGSLQQGLVRRKSRISLP